MNFEGLFWQELPDLKPARTLGMMPQIPPTGWRPPSEFPNLSAAKVIGVDTETYDPELEEAGPGWGRGRGHIVGVSLAVQDGTSWYFPIRHGIVDSRQLLPPQEAALNMDPATVLRWLDHVLSTAVPKVGANLIYDVGWLNWEGVRIGGPLYDVQFAEALLNSETPDVTLDSLAYKYLNEGKVTNALYNWLAQYTGTKAGPRQRGNIYLSPPSLAGPYAEGDASLPIGILENQWPLMIKRGVVELFNMECGLIPLLVAMRMKGAPVDVGYSGRLFDELENDLRVPAARLREISGREVNPNAGDSIKAAFEACGIPIPTKINDAGNEVPTFAAKILEDIAHPLTETILEYRRIEKIKNTFVKGYILDKNISGRIYCSFHPLKGEGGGARSGRFASSDPNLQNIPSRTEIGRKVRKAFVAKVRWRKFDYSQIEYRMLAHHAVGPGSHELRLAYQNNPDIDYHKLTGGLVLDMTGIELQRTIIKNINFGLIYGMSEPALAQFLLLELAKAKELFAAYHKAAPYARATMEAAAAEVNELGYVSTILGRKSDFDRWEKAGYGGNGGRRGMSYESAVAKYGTYGIQRSAAHKGLNRKLQGGAADVLKRAMLTAYQAGLFAEDACGIPILTVHDELDFDDMGDEHNPAWNEFKHIMENASNDVLSVPVRIDMGIGPNWGAIS